MNPSLKELPWVEPFLERIHGEYAKSPPSYRLIEPTESSYAYVYSLADTSDPFDTAHLKHECGVALKRKQATLFRSVCDLGEILMVSIHKYPMKPQWNLWWRCVRLLCPKGKPARIVLFGHPRERRVPSQLPNVIEKEHLNGGATMPCSPMDIVVYRKEEATRVLIHELFHASCSDPYHKDTAQIEADTEAWAEMVLCGMAAKGQIQPWIRHMRQQLTWASKQAASVQTYYNVRSEKDYAWRYLVGRLAVWRRLGIQVPSFPNHVAHIRSTRFSLCEPGNN
jgi:hypothetical protein